MEKPLKPIAETEGREPGKPIILKWPLLSASEIVLHATQRNSFLPSGQLLRPGCQNNFVAVIETFVQLSSNKQM
ncbi:hypothetical protein E2320_019764 [Naja naja]|nr:hypothetical protein E2320_019764 [Naja naja]